jgi:hypothetical protein
MAHDFGSFNYKVIDPRITKILDSRSSLDNTRQIAMPFIKATTTLQLPDIIGDGAKGFTLGIHAIDEDLKYEDMYTSIDGNTPLIGYTYLSNNTTKKVYAYEPTGLGMLSKLYDKNILAKDSTRNIRIPPPGINQVVIGRNKNGLLAHAQLSITVPSLIQLESLHRTFLVPGIGMVLEWGQQFAPEVSPDGEEMPDISEYLFPWNDRAKLDATLDKLARNTLGLPEILENYVYNSNGQYMWMFGRVGNFNITSNSDGSFNCAVKIVGPSEDAWAYSTKTTVVPAKDASINLCASDTNSVGYYIANETRGVTNFISLLEGTINNKESGKNKNQAIPELSDWKDHVIYFEQSAKDKQTKDGDGEEDNKNVSKTWFSNKAGSYFISWRYFVNIVLNHETLGIKGIFNRPGVAQGEDQLKKIALLMPLGDGDSRDTSVGDISKKKYINDPVESYVGYNPYLRSIDPSTLLIINEEAAVRMLTERAYTEKEKETLGFSKREGKAEEFYKVGAFDESTSAVELAPDRGLLSSGVWINHKAICESMLSADTILRGVVNLLDRMNAATLNYWKLTIDAIEPIQEYGTSHNYIVVDANLRENSELATKNFIKNVHLFNKYIRRSPEGALVGSELLECSLDLSLPRILFTQIATLGLIQKEDLVKIGIADGNDKNAKVSDPNDSFREMFAITTISTSDPNKPSPDLTYLPHDDTNSANRICAGSNAQTSGETAGTGGGMGSKMTRDRNLRETADLNGSLLTAGVKDIKKYADAVANDPTCINCKNCAKVAAPTTPTPAAAAPVTTNRKLTQLTIGEVRAIQKDNGGTVLAVGKYQGIPGTLRDWIRAENIPLDIKFDAAAQSKFGTWLLKSKRKVQLIPYLEGDGTELELRIAQTGLAQEFASMPVYGPSNSQISYYAGKANNSAAVTSGVLQEKLRQARQIYKDNPDATIEALKQFISQYEGSLDAINRGDAGDTPSTGNSGNPDMDTIYYKALDPNAVPVKARLSAKPESSTCTDEAYAEIGRTGFQSSAARRRTKVGSPEAEIPYSRTTTGKRICEVCSNAADLSRQASVVEAEKTQIEKFVREFETYNQAFRYIEYLPDDMIQRITNEADGILSNAFGASPGSLSISADLVMPGINGIRVGELFWIDRMPAFYKAFGAFQVLSIEDTVDSSGWKTKIHSRFNYLGTTWRDAMYKELGVGA